jgi:hypothetical protein
MVIDGRGTDGGGTDGAPRTRRIRGDRRAVPGVRVVAVATSLVGVLVLLAGCSGQGDDAADDGAAVSEERVPDAGAADAADAGADAGAGDAAGAGGDPATGEVADGVPAAPSGRRVVTASLTVATEDVAGAAADARDLAVRVGGFVATETTTGTASGDEPPTATLSLRVPVDSSEDVIDDLAALGDEVRREVGSEDVEARLVDLESRVASARASIARVRDLLELAEDLEDVVLLEGELTRRQADYESLEAQRTALSDLADLATVTVTFSTPEAAAAQGAGAPGFLGGLEAGWRALSASTTIALTVLGAVLPFALVIGAVVGVAAVGWALLRARARHRSPA